MRPKRGAPSCFPRLSCGLLGFGDPPTCLLYCVFDHFGRYIKGGGKCADQASGLIEVAGQKLVEPPQTFGNVFV